MNYLDEQEIREEMLKLQKVEKLKELLAAEFKTDSMLKEIANLKAEGVDPKYKRTRFGEMCLLLIRRILTMPKFSGYTYHDDFTSNAISKLMSYAVKNYDDNKISKISGEKVKVFAYLTQIIMNAIIQVINEKKAEQEFLQNIYVENTEKDLRMMEMEKQVEEEHTIIYDYIINFVYKIDDEWYKIVEPRKKEPFETNLEEGIYYQINNGEFKPFESVYDILSSLETSSSIKMIYPHTYTIKETEFKKILNLQIKNLNLTKYNNSYVPSFPKKQKQEKEQELDLWAD